MTSGELEYYSNCKFKEGEFRNMSIDDSRKTTVPTYTLDLLVSSLEGPDLGRVKLDEEIFAVKIDTEGIVKWRWMTECTYVLSVTRHSHSILFLLDFETNTYPKTKVMMATSFLVPSICFRPNESLLSYLKYGQTILWS